MKILILYAGIGGNRKRWGDDHEITAVEINPTIAAIYKRYFPNDIVIIGDAHQYLIEHFREFDIIWGSPPCQSHTKNVLMNYVKNNFTVYPDMKLWQEIIFLKQFAPEGLLWVIENVKPYYNTLINPSIEINRHLFWSNFNITPRVTKNIKNFMDAKFEDLKKWLGYDDFNDRIYLPGSHDYCQILRNCVHPEIGLHVLNCALEKIEDNKQVQLKINF